MVFSRSKKKSHLFEQLTFFARLQLKYPLLATRLIVRTENKEIFHEAKKKDTN